MSREESLPQDPTACLGTRPTIILSVPTGEPAVLTSM
jgi:hypothetical protein